jgi:hypothetical protein
VKFTGPDGWAVEAARLSLVAAPHRDRDPHGDGEYLIVRRYGRTVAFAKSVAEVVATGCPLADLEETA